MFCNCTINVKNGFNNRVLSINIFYILATLYQVCKQYIIDLQLSFQSLSSLWEYQLPQKEQQFVYCCVSGTKSIFVNVYYMLCSSIKFCHNLLKQNINTVKPLFKIPTVKELTFVTKYFLSSRKTTICIMQFFQVFKEP